MSSFARLGLLAGTCFLLGGALGAYGTRTLYGNERDVRHPNPEEAFCPPCPDCPSCPPAEPCGHVPPPDDTPARFAPANDTPTRAAVPGLPPALLAKAQAMVQRAVDPCLVGGAESKGLLVVTFTLTSSEGVASIASADISERQDLEDDSPTEDCVIEHAKELRLDWGGEDGRQEFLMPLQVRP